MDRLRFAKAAVPAFVLLIGSAAALAADPAPLVPVDPSWRLAFNEDFDTLSLRSGGPEEVGVALGKGTWTARWPWARDPKGSWPNGSEYAWFPDPAYAFGGGYPPTGQFSVKDSILTIRAERTPRSMAGKMIDVTGNTDVTTKRTGEFFPWVSGTLTTYDSFSVGGPAYVEGRIKIPQGGKGVWPAFWALTKNWRSKGHSEVDFFEFFGSRTSEWQIHAFNGCGYNPSCAAKISKMHRAKVDLSRDFHVYGCLRTAKQFVFFLDGVEVHRGPVPGDDFAPDNLYLMIDVQMGSDLPGFLGAPNRTTPSPQLLQVDYIRVWASPTPSATGKAARNEKDYPSTIAYLEDQASHGDGYAARVLGDAYADGRGVRYDSAAAEKWRRVGAEAGQPDAQLALAKMYDYGLGVVRDHAEAIRWYRIVAETEGWPEAQRELGLAYLSGEGIKADLKLAAKWLRKAAAQGDTSAAEVLAGPKFRKP